MTCFVFIFLKESEFASALYQGHFIGVSTDPEQA